MEQTMFQMFWCWIPMNQCQLLVNSFIIHKECSSNAILYLTCFSRVLLTVQFFTRQDRNLQCNEHDNIQTFLSEFFSGRSCDPGGEVHHVADKVLHHPFPFFSHLISILFIFFILFQFSLLCTLLAGPSFVWCSWSRESPFRGVATSSSDSSRTGPPILRSRRSSTATRFVQNCLWDYASFV